MDTAITYSPQQQAVFDWAKDETGSLILIARAGCGKTFTLIETVSVILKAQPRAEIFIGAFNKSIAAEIKGKLEAKDINWKSANASTMHSAGYSAWRKVAPRVQIEDKKTFNIINGFWPDQESFQQKNSVTLAKLVSLAKQSGFGALRDAGDRTSWETLVDHHDLEQDISDEVTVHELCQWAYKVLMEGFERDTMVIDFDDMLLAPLVHKARFWPKDWVLIDEAQDTNPVRRAIALAMLKRGTGRLIAVGDDRQAIYGFTGADSDALELIKKATHSRTLYLTTTYRCPKAVVGVAQQFVPDIETGEGAPEGRVMSGVGFLNDLPKKGKRNADIFNWVDLVPGQDAILCRNTKPLIEVAYSLIRRKIPVRVLGRDIGQGLIKLTMKWKTQSLDELLERLEEYKVKECARWEKKNRSEKVAAVEDKVDTLTTIINAVEDEGSTCAVDVERFINDLFGDEDTRHPRITLCTVHKSKGLEWKRVIILGWTEYMPSKFARKEWQALQEQNLQYVAVTRAQDILVLA